MEDFRTTGDRLRLLAVIIPMALLKVAFFLAIEGALVGVIVFFATAVVAWAFGAEHVRDVAIQGFMAGALIGALWSLAVRISRMVGAVLDHNAKERVRKILEEP